MKHKYKIKKPRLYIFKSNKHLYAYIIDDNQKKILTSSSTISKEINNTKKVFRNCMTAQIIGKNIALKLKQKGIYQIIFDRGNNIYHGQIKALADATRKEGIIF
uniref:Large ribosomal subunit protein uL18c n=1 Tax=Kuetzingia canaliculata TaxID=228262 RepID=A0A1Z1MPA8_KUECA|nr:ribosomal protein L18 [Kuetzingia canaliculata]ARW67927.1 ribosomal protein L18 [Kuetzingia canaliculata]